MITIETDLRNLMVICVREEGQMQGYNMEWEGRGSQCEKLEGKTI
jgi:hypothetical protein